MRTASAPHSIAGSGPQRGTAIQAPGATTPNEFSQRQQWTELQAFYNRTDVIIIACSHRRHGQAKLSCLVRVGGANTIGDKTQQSCLVSTQFPIWVFSSRPSFQFAIVQSQIYCGLLKTWKLETGTRQDKTVLSCLQLCSHRRHDKTRQCCLVCCVGGVKKL